MGNWKWSDSDAFPKNYQWSKRIFKKKIVINLKLRWHNPSIDSAYFPFILRKTANFAENRISQLWKHNAQLMLYIRSNCCYYKTDTIIVRWARVSSAYAHTRWMYFAVYGSVEIQEKFSINWEMYRAFIKWDKTNTTYFKGIIDFIL